MGSRAIVFLAVVLGFTPFASALTLAERLGYSTSDKLLILHVDDLGSHQSANRAARDVFSFGLARSGSVLMPAPRAADVAVMVANDRALDLGVHLTLNGERDWKPVAPRMGVPSLVEGSGNLVSSALSLFLFAQNDDVSRELEAQIQRAITWGLNPSHLDTHMGSVFFKPKWLATYLNLAKKYHVPPMIPRWSSEMRDQVGVAGRVLDWILPSLYTRMEKSGHLMLDYFYILPQPEDDMGYAARRAEYVRLIKNLKPGVSQIVLHTAYNEGDFREQVVARNRGQLLRDYEARIFQEPEIRRLLNESGVKLIGWRAIADVYPWAQVTDML